MAVADILRNKNKGQLPSLERRDNRVGIYFLLPAVIVTSLREGLRVFDRKTGGRLICNEGLLIAAETRTSSPVRIVRDQDMRQGKGLYPAGEGAGYAGGIVSAAIDGSEAAKRLAGEING